VTRSSGSSSSGSSSSSSSSGMRYAVSGCERQRLHIARPPRPAAHVQLLPHNSRARCGPAAAAPAPLPPRPRRCVRR
jgi:hypothetical protein